MLVRIQPQPDMTCQDLILLLTELRVDLLGGSPHGGAVFLAIPRPAALRVVEAQAHDVGPRAGEDRQQAFVCPLDLKWVLQCGGQVREQIRQAVTQGLGDEQRRPDDRDVKEKTKNKVVLICLLQAGHLREYRKSGPGSGIISAAGAAV